MAMLLVCFERCFSTSVLPALGLFIASLILGEALRGVVMRSSFFFAYSWQGSIALALALLLDRLLDALRLRHVKETELEAVSFLQKICTCLFK